MRTRIVEKNMFFGANISVFEKAHILRKNMTYAEKIMWDELKNKKLLKFRLRRQHPIDIFIVDFYCHELKLVIEIDGEFHNEEEIKEYDDGRTCEIEKFGIKILRFTNYQVLNHRGFVIKEIIETINRLYKQ